MDPESENDGRLVLPAPTGPTVAETSGPLIVDDKEEDTTVEANATAMQAAADPPFSLPSPVPASAGPGRARLPPPSGSAAIHTDPDVIEVRPVEKPRSVVSWRATLAAGVIGFALGGVFFGRPDPATPPVVLSTPLLPPTPPAPVVEAVPPPPAPEAPARPQHTKVLKLDEVVLTAPDPTAP